MLDSVLLTATDMAQDAIDRSPELIARLRQQYDIQYQPHLFIVQDTHLEETMVGDDWIFHGTLDRAVGFIDGAFIKGGTLSPLLRASRS
jgi:hypothetical protein